MIFEYNNKSYYIPEVVNNAILMARGDLLSLPLPAWKELLLQIYNAVSYPTLQTVLKYKVLSYDDSAEVNKFTYKGITTWWDKDTRVGLMNLANCSTQDLEIAVNNSIFVISVDDLKSLLTSLEVYAGKCFIATKKHLNAISELEDEESIINYNYTSGYPEPIVIE